MRLSTAFLILAAVATSAHSAPVPTYPVLAIVRDPAFIPVSIPGTGFGAASSPAKLTVDDGTGVLTDIPVAQTCNPPTVSDTCIVFWDDAWITAKLAPTLTRASVRITTAASETTDFMRVQYWAYDTWDTDPDAAETATNPAPHSILVNTLDPDRTVWIGEEFHLGFKKWTAAQNSVTLQPTNIPVPAPFAGVGNPFPIQQSQSRQLALDPSGRVWLTETGQPFYNGDLPNHARIWMYGGSETRAYNIPGDHSALHGIAYEANYSPGHDRVWYVVRQRNAHAINARVGWFDVDANAPCVGGQCQFGQAQSCSSDADCPVWSDGTTAFSPTAACTRACRDINFPNEACSTDADCAPSCASGQCRLGKPGTCTVDGDCAPQCGPFVCLSGTGLGCFFDSNCVSTCTTGFCADDPARECLLSSDCWADTIACAWNDSNPACRFHEYPLPDDSSVTGYMALGKDPGTGQFDGKIWVADYLSSALRRLDIATGAVITYPMGDDPTRPSAAWFLGSNPFGIYVASNGDPILNEYSDSTLDRFDVSRADDTACRSLTGTVNPCVRSQIPPVNGDYDIHSIAPDRSENTWFTMEGPTTDPTSRATVGFVKRDWSGIAMFPPLSLYPFDSSTLEGTNENISFYCQDPNNPNSDFRAFRGAGIGVDTGTDEVFVAEYCRKRLGRFRPVKYDLALARSATESSTWCNASGHCGPASAAVDGNINGSFPLGSVAHTFDSNKPWWQVDLGASYPIDGIEIWNRTDCCSTRLQNFYVFVSDQPFTSTDPDVVKATQGVLAIYQATFPGNRFTANVNRSGRYVRVQLAGTTDPLQLAEVVVLGSHCTTDAACDDGQYCTTDTCDLANLGICQHSCNGGQLCPINGTCSGTCQDVSGTCMCVQN